MHIEQFESRNPAQLHPFTQYYPARAADIGCQSAGPAAVSHGSLAVESYHSQEQRLAAESSQSGSGWQQQNHHSLGQLLAAESSQSGTATGVAQCLWPLKICECRCEARRASWSWPTGCGCGTLTWSASGAGGTGNSCCTARCIRSCTCGAGGRRPGSGRYASTRACRSHADRLLLDKDGCF